MTEPQREPVWRRTWIGDNSFRDAWGQEFTRLQPGETLVKSWFTVYIQSDVISNEPMPQVPWTFWHAVVTTTGSPPPPPPRADEVTGDDDVLWWDAELMEFTLEGNENPDFATATAPWPGPRRLEIQAQRRNDTESDEIGIWWIWAQSLTTESGFAGFGLASLLVLEETSP